MGVLGIKNIRTKNLIDPVLYDYAMQFVGLPYRWGGDDTIEGYDCSGFVLELLYSCGLVDIDVDMTAQGLYYYINGKMGTRSLGLSFGSLVFYGSSSSKITHVAFGMDHLRVIEAGGGGRSTRTKQDAADHNAYIRLRPMDYRGDRVAIMRPAYDVSNWV